MSNEAMKQAAARAAIDYIEEGAIIGIGTGSTAACFIALLAEHKHRIAGAVASSERSAQQLRAQGIELHELNNCATLPIYVDGVDEVTTHLHLTKGGGGALTREKIIASASERFICIADQTKLSPRLGKFPLPIEVIPMARSCVARKLTAFGRPEWRIGTVTDNQNTIIDLHGMDIIDPVEMERELNQIAGVVCVGLFAQRGADVLLLGQSDGTVKTLTRT